MGQMQQMIQQLSAHYNSGYQALSQKKLETASKERIRDFKGQRSNGNSKSTNRI